MIREVAEIRLESVEVFLQEICGFDQIVEALEKRDDVDEPISEFIISEDLLLELSGLAECVLDVEELIGPRRHREDELEDGRGFQIEGACEF